MEKMKVLNRITEEGLVAVVRAGSVDEAIKIVEALKEGGIDIIEITFTVPKALKVLESLANRYDKYDLLLGAGTVLDQETARLAILAGAEFVVSPSCEEAVVRLCHRYQKVVMPGAMTVKEVLAAMEAGADLIKLFPGDVLGPKGAKAIKGPLPQAPLFPTGGVSLDNIGDWFSAGVIGVGVGGELTREALLKNDYSLAAGKARKFVEEVKKHKKT